jgi:DNA invertase Pin-like site-specific DNA recombinase
MRVLYSRCSTLEQNPGRQLQDKNYDYIFTDYCSGSIPLFERPKGSQIKKLIDEGLLKELHIHSIDRLGRNTLDVLSVWEQLTSKGILIECKNPLIKNIDENGKVDKFSELLMSILSTMSSYEKGLIRERQMEGIRLRQSQNLYTGRRVGTKDTSDRLLSKDRSKRILDYLSKGTYSYQEISKIVGCSPTTIVKVKKMSQMVSN